MKHYQRIMVAGMTVSALIGGVLSASAVGATLTNGGFGQRSTDPTSFGLATCNSGAAAFSGSIPMTVSTNNVTQTVNETLSLAPGACSYDYIPYATFGMTSGKTYSISVTIDPQGDANQATYGAITVPQTSASGQVLGASTMSDTQRNLLLSELAAAEAELHSLLAKIGTQ